MDEDQEDPKKTAAKAVFGVVALFGMFIIIIPFLISGAGAAATPPPSECGSAGTGGTVANVTLTADEMANAQTIVQTVAGLNLPSFAAVVAVATAGSESHLINSPAETDHDSEGLFQQRISIYGKDVADDPVKSTKAFVQGLPGITGLVQIPNWQQDSIYDDAYAVQKFSTKDGNADRYNERIQEFTPVADQLVGQFWAVSSANAGNSGGNSGETTDAVTTATTTAGGGGSGTGAGTGEAGGTSTKTFVTDVLTELNLPVSTGNLDAFYNVAAIEGQNDYYNPINSSQKEPGSTDFNSAGVQRYASFDSGVAGTVDLLKGSNWASLVAAMRANGGLNSVLSVWDQDYAAYNGGAVTFRYTSGSAADKKALAAVAARAVGPNPGSSPVAGAPICPGGGEACAATPTSCPAGTGDNEVPKGLILDGSPQGDAAVQYALDQLPLPYCYGGGTGSGPSAGDLSECTPPTVGFDCSGLVMTAWERQHVYPKPLSAGEPWAHFAATQAAYGSAEPTDLSQAVSGDLVFIPGSDGTMAAPGHVGMVAGYTTGKGGSQELWIVHASDHEVGIIMTPAKEFGPVADVRHIA